MGVRPREPSFEPSTAISLLDTTEDYALEPCGLPQHLTSQVGVAAETVIRIKIVCHWQIEEQALMGRQVDPHLLDRGNPPPQPFVLAPTFLLQVPQTPLRGAWIGLCVQFQKPELVIEQAS